MNTPPNMCKVSTPSDKTKNNTKTADCLLQCVLLNRLFGILFQTFAESRSMFVYFRICKKIPLTVLWQKIFYILLGFYQYFIFKFNMVNFNM